MRDVIDSDSSSNDDLSESSHDERKAPIFSVIDDFPEKLRALPLHESPQIANLVPRSGPIKLRRIDLGLYNLPGSDESPHPVKRFPEAELFGTHVELLTGTVVFRRPSSAFINGAVPQRLVDHKWILDHKGPELADPDAENREEQKWELQKQLEQSAQQKQRLWSAKESASNASTGASTASTSTTTSTRSSSSCACSPSSTASHMHKFGIHPNSKEGSSRPSSCKRKGGKNGGHLSASVSSASSRPSSSSNVRSRGSALAAIAASEVKTPMHVPASEQAREGNSGKMNSHRSGSGSRPASSRAPVAASMESAGTPPVADQLPDFDENAPPPIFDSSFEGGNLASVVRNDEDPGVFDLILDEDMNGCGNTQWYFFSVRNMEPGQTVTFRIINLGKNGSLYEIGQRPLVYCVDSEVNLDIPEDQLPPWETNPKAGWSRCGTEISYTCANMSKGEMYDLMPSGIRVGDKVRRTTEENSKYPRGPMLNKLIWRYTFETSGLVYFAAVYPYSFTRLLKVLDAIDEDPIRQKHVRRSLLCTTVSGNRVDCVTITDTKSSAFKKVICITARVHPGETVGSIACEGILDFLTSEKVEADKLRKHYVFKIVPMLNPDGVINGNYRCSALGVDLNRRWRYASRNLQPSIWYTKRMLHRLHREEPIALYIDLHGHSRRLDWFVYGCRTEEMGQQTLRGERNWSENPGIYEPGIPHQVDPLVLPIKLRHQSDTFNLNFCSFQVASCKDQTARVTVWRELKVAAAYTIEISLAGTSGSPGSKANGQTMTRHFTCQDFWNMGKAMCCAMISQIPKPELQGEEAEKIPEPEEDKEPIDEEVGAFLDEVVTREHIPDSESDGNLTDGDSELNQVKEKKRKRKKHRNGVPNHRDLLRLSQSTHHLRRCCSTSSCREKPKPGGNSIGCKKSLLGDRQELKPKQGRLFEFPEQNSRVGRNATQPMSRMELLRRCATQVRESTSLITSKFQPSGSSSFFDRDIRLESTQPSPRPQAIGISISSCSDGGSPIRSYSYPFEVPMANHKLNMNVIPGGNNYHGKMSYLMNKRSSSSATSLPCNTQYLVPELGEDNTRTYKHRGFAGFAKSIVLESSPHAIYHRYGPSYGRSNSTNDINMQTRYVGEGPKVVNLHAWPVLEQRRCASRQ